MQTLKIFSTKALQLVAPMCGKTVSKTLHVDALIQALKADFGKLTDHRAKNAKIALDDAIMSAFAMFHLKDQSLLAFDSMNAAAGNRKTYIRSMEWPTFPATLRCAPSWMRLTRLFFGQHFELFSGGCSVARSWNQ